MKLSYLIGLGSAVVAVAAQGGFGGGFGNQFGNQFDNNKIQQSQNNQNSGDNNLLNQFGNINGGENKNEDKDDEVEKEDDDEEDDGDDGDDGDKDFSESLESDNNFSDFCSGKTPTNGLQVEEGSCNITPMGDIPAKDKMVSQIIVFPKTGETIKAAETFSIDVQSANLEAGSFTDPKSTYYNAPQQLKNGKIIGHTHVTVQSLGNDFNPTQPLDTTQFVFFKGINDAGDGNGLLSAKVDDGLPAGFYRVCTLGGSSNHTPLILPVAQRGSADDCTKFQVTDGDAQAQNDDQDEGDNDDSDDDDDGDNQQSDRRLLRRRWRTVNFIS